MPFTIFLENYLFLSFAYVIYNKVPAEQLHLRPSRVAQKDQLERKKTYSNALPLERIMSCYVTSHDMT